MGQTPPSVGQTVGGAAGLKMKKERRLSRYCKPLVYLSAGIVFIFKSILPRRRGRQLTLFHPDMKANRESSTVSPSAHYLSP